MDLTPVTASEVQAWVRGFNGREALLVLEEEGSVQGWGIIKRYTDRPGYRFAAETALYLSREHVGQRRGYGSLLLEAVIERSRSLDYHHLVAKIWATNVFSRALYEKFGFELVGIQREIGFVEGVWKDIALYQRLMDTSVTFPSR